MQQRSFMFYKFRIGAFVCNLLVDAKWHEMYRTRDPQRSFIKTDELTFAVTREYGKCDLPSHDILS